MPEEPQAVDAVDVAVPAQGPEPREPAAPQAPTPADPGPQDAVSPAPPVVKQPHPRTRISGLWIALGCFAVLLLLALLFILQNSHSVDVSYFGAHGHLPLGVALLLAAICGGMLVTLVGTARILQLRAVARRQRQQLKAKS